MAHCLQKSFFFHSRAPIFCLLMVLSFVGIGILWSIAPLTILSLNVGTLIRMIYFITNTWNLLENNKNGKLHKTLGKNIDVCVDSERNLTDTGTWKETYCAWKKIKPSKIKEMYFFHSIILTPRPWLDSFHSACWNYFIKITVAVINDNGITF